MNSSLPTALLQALREYLLSKMGLSFSERQDYELVRKIGNAASAFGHTNSKLFTEWLLSTKLTDQQTSQLAAFLTIGETYFFREKKSFDFLEHIYLPGLIRKRYGSDNKHLSIWCAGCASGEEAYSLAIALTKTIPDIKNWNISIQATDINPIFLDQAKKGIYKKWSFRNNSEEFITKNFEKIGENEYHILPEIKKMVHFSYLNLAEKIYPSMQDNHPTVDILFCRNVLIYFSTEGSRQVSERFYDSLVDGGILVVSPVEMSSLISPKFNTIHYSGYTIYHKGHLPKNKKVPKTDGISPEKPEAPMSTSFQNKVLTFSQEEKPDFLPKKEPLPEKTALPKTPTGSENELIQARSLYEKGLFSEAEVILDKLLKLADQSGEVLFLVAKTKANLGKLKEAEELCAKGLSIDKLIAGFHYLLATVMQEQGKDEDAVASLKMAIYLEPDFVLANFLLGTLNLKIGNQEAGMKSFKNALASLSKFSPTDLIPESGGLTAERFTEIINTIKK